MIGNGSSGASNIYKPLFCIVLLYGFLGTFFAFFISQVDKKLLKKITLIMIIVSTLHFLLLGF
jgi:hypothetical protein